MTSVAARTNNRSSMENRSSATSTMLSPPQPQHRDDRRRSHTTEALNNTTLSSSPEVPRRSYSPISNSEDLATKDPTIASAPFASDGSSALSEVEDHSDDNQKHGSDRASELSEDDRSSDNETEAETERLHISPQKLREQQLAEGQDGPEEDEVEQQPDLGARPDLRPQDILGEAREDRDSSLSDMEDADAEGLRSPGAIAGHKRKRNGELLPSNDFLSADLPSPRKRSSVRRSFGLKPPPAEPLPLEEAGPADEDAVSSEDEEQEAIDKIESARNESLTPAPEQEGEVRPGAEPEEPAELEAEDDEAETAAKTEDDIARKNQALESFKPIEKMFAFLRDRMYREKWESYTAELELLQNPNTTHTDFIAMRQAVDARRDEKQRLEHVALEYKTKNLGSTILAKRAQIHAQYYQEVREIRDKGLETLNSDYCQIQRERRQFIRKEPYFLPKFSPDRRKQVEDQQRYNKEVSLLSGIARHKGFPSAPALKNTAQEELEDDFKSMRVPQTVPRAVSYSELARHEHANEAAAEKSWAERTPWADPNHPLLHRAPVIQAQNTRIPIATPPTPVQPWMLNCAPAASTEQRPEAARSDPRNQHNYTDNTQNGGPTSSPFDQLKRQPTNEPAPTSWRDNVQAHLANRLSNNTTPRVDKSPFETRATKTSASFPIDPTSLHQSYATSALHSGGMGGSRAGSELLGNAGFAPRPGALGTPGFEREGSRMQGFPGFGPIGGEERRDGGMHRTPEAPTATSVGGAGGR